MQHPIAIPVERRAAMRLVIDIMQIVMDTTSADDLETAFIACAVALGHAEGRPMNQQEISELVHVKRQTVARKLDQLIQGGDIVRDPDDARYYLESERAERPDSGILKRWAVAFANACGVLRVFMKDYSPPKAA